VAIGTLALASVIEQLFDLWHQGGEATNMNQLKPTQSVSRLSGKEFFSHWKTLGRSSMIGSIVGMLPGLGVTLAAFLSYGSARRASSIPESFGKGNPEGIIATEAANSAVVGSNLIPTIALGIPGNMAAALLLSAFIIHGIVPGPLMMTMHGELVYALFASMILANGVHLLVGRLGIPIWGLVAKTPKAIILPPVMVMCIVGVYLPGQSLFDVGVMLIFAGIGLVMKRTGFSLVCLVIGFLLGGMFETSLRQTLLMYKSNYSVILQSPITLIFLFLTIFILLRSAFRSK
jgi:putative tricarboxylic transport membrane protein